MNPSVYPEDGRRVLARVLSQHYDKLAGNEHEERRFQFGRAITQMSTHRGLQDGYEAEVCAGAATIAGRQHDPWKAHFPFSAFQRDLTVASAPGGGYLVASDKQRPSDILRSWSVVANAGVTILSGLVGNPTVPQVIDAAQATWKQSELQTISPDDLSIGEVVATPKQAVVLIRFSHQLASQVDAFDQFIEDQLKAGVGAALDQAVIAGIGAAGQPTGIVNTAGIGTQAGAALSHAGTKTMRKQVLDAGGLEQRFSWVGATDVQDVLGGRERFTGGGRAIWDDGNILGRPANATKYAPAGTLIGGDWRHAVVCIWGPGFTVEIDPFTYFQTKRLQARIVLDCDLIVAPAAAFSVATSVS